MPSAVAALGELTAMEGAIKTVGHVNRKEDYGSPRRCAILALVLFENLYI
jgi:hypothetical protein